MLKALAPDSLLRANKKVTLLEGPDGPDVASMAASHEVTSKGENEEDTIEVKEGAEVPDKNKV